MKFFFDNNLPRRVAHSLHELWQPDGYEIVHLADRFEPNASDELWISRLGAEGGWNVVTKDVGIKRRKQQRIVWRESGLTMIFLKRAWHNVGFHQLALQLLKRWPAIVVAAAENPGSGIVVPYSGKIERFKI